MVTETSGDSQLSPVHTTRPKHTQGLQRCCSAAASGAHSCTGAAGVSANVPHPSKGWDAEFSIGTASQLVGHTRQPTQPHTNAHSCPHTETWTLSQLPRFQGFQANQCSTCQIQQVLMGRKASYCHLESGTATYSSAPHRSKNTRTHAITGLAHTVLS